MMLVPLPAEVYYQLRWLQAEQEKQALRVRLAQQWEQEATRRYQQALTDAGREQGFDPTVPYTWDEATRSLRPMAPRLVEAE